MSVMNQPFDWGHIRQLLAQEPWALYDPDCTEVRRAIGLGFVHNLAPHGNYTYARVHDRFNGLEFQNWSADDARYVKQLREQVDNQCLNLDEVAYGTATYLLINEGKDVNDLVPGDYFVDPRSNHIWELAEEDGAQIPDRPYTPTYLLEHLLPVFRKKRY